MLKLEQENSEVRTRLLSRQDNSKAFEELEREKYLLEVRVKELTEAAGGTVPQLDPTPAAAKLDLSAETDIEKLKREMQLQEQLILGYQKENEKLVAETRRLQLEVKGEHSRMM
jgi:hypothetical protein